MGRIARRWIATIVSASLLALAVGGPSRSSATATPVSISALRPIGPDGAWVWLDRSSSHTASSRYAEEIALTLDGGRSWLVRTPPGLATANADRSIVQLAAAGTADAWVSYAGVTTGSPQTLVATTDGGRRWRRRGRLPSPYCALQFLSAEVGWCVTTLAATGTEAVTVYRTGDGGRHWTLESASASPQQPGTPGSLPVGCDKILALTAPTVGWAALECPTGLSPMYESVDAGKTWRRQSVAAPPAGYRLGSDATALWTSAPVSKGAMAAAGLEVEAADVRSLVYRSTDAGHIWFPVSPPGTPRRWSVDVVTPTIWKLSSGRTVLTTTDAGASWRTVASDLALPVQGGPLFVSAEDGWYVSSSQRTLYRTHSGGAAWKPVRLPRLPRRAP